MVTNYVVSSKNSVSPRTSHSCGTEKVTLSEWDSEEEGYHDSNKVFVFPATAVTLKLFVADVESIFIFHLLQSKTTQPFQCHNCTHPLNLTSISRERVSFDMNSGRTGQSNKHGANWFLLGTTVGTGNSGDCQG